MTFSKNVFEKILFLILFFYSFEVQCQYYHDNNILQYINKWDNTSGLARLYVDQDKDTITYEILSTKFSNHSTNICMSDSNGNFIFGSNGLSVFNRKFEIMKNGDYINKPGVYSDSIHYYSDYSSYNISSSLNAIPLPGQSNHYLFVHNSLYTDNQKRYHQALSYTHIDMKDSLGIVVDKNKLIMVRATYTPLFIKHANGKDWWLISADSRSNHFYVFLIDKRGIIGPQIQQEGSIMDSFYWYKIDFNYNSLLASPNGEYIVSQKPEFIDIFTFDRCRGKIKMLKKIQLITYPVYSPIQYDLGRSEFSPNSEFFYFTIGRNFYQLNIASSQPEFSVKKIGQTTYDAIITRLVRVGSKIVIFSKDPFFTVSLFLGLISKADLPSTACQLLINLYPDYPTHSPNAYMYKLPVFPNYYLTEDKNVNMEDCSKGFFFNELEAAPSFTLDGKVYNTLLRKFKK